MLDPEVAYQSLRSANLRLTVQRRAVVEALAGDETHPSAEELHTRLAERVPGLSLSTVYKVLHELVDLGLVRQVEVPGTMRFDPDETDHVHVVCDGCGDILDAALPEAVIASIRASVPGGVKIDRFDVVARGICPRCAA